MTFRNHYSPPKKVYAPKPTGKAKTQQHAKNECDINQIVKKIQKTGQFPELIAKNPQYGDFSETPSYQDALNTVLIAEEQFMALPAIARKQFNNDPQTFLDYVHNPETKAEDLVKLGLAHLTEHVNETLQRKEKPANEADSTPKTPPNNPT